MQNYFEQINNYFDKIYVLSLPRLHSRIDYITNTLKGLDYDFFFGVDKQQTSYDELSNSGYYNQSAFEIYNKRPEQIYLGMLCCAVGHVKIYESIILNNYKKTLILEDDLIPIWENLSLFNEASVELPVDWDIWYLGYEKNEKYRFKEMVKKNFYKIIPNHTSLKLNSKVFSNYYPKKLSTHISRAGFHDCTHSYAITLEAAKKMLAVQKPVHWNPDNALAYMGCTEQLKNYIITPKLFNQLTAFNNNIETLTSDG